jgi:hypothetical protein
MRSALVLVSVVLVACGVYQVNTLPPSQVLDEPMSIQRPGPLVQPLSGLEFAESYGGFARVSAVRYDTEGLNLAIGYNDARPDCPIVLTFYIYPAPRMSFIGAAPSVVVAMQRSWLDAEYAQCKAEIAARHAGLESPVDASTTTQISGEQLKGALFTYRERQVRSELRLFVWKLRWFVKYRITYPLACQELAGSRLTTLISEMPSQVRDP